jgi:hypothetical protein
MLLALQIGGLLPTTHSHLSTFADPDILDGSLTRTSSTCASRPNVFDHSHDLHAFRHLPEDDMFPVQERGRSTRDEKLTTIGVRARIGHGQQASSSMLVHKRLVGKRRVVVDRRRSRAVGIQKIASLYHEILDL